MNRINAQLPFTHYVWFMQNGDDQWRVCAATMDESDAEALAHKINNDGSGAGLALPVDERPEGDNWFFA